VLTLNYAGTYSYGTDVEKGGIGTIFIYPETDSTILFYIDLNRGAPSYNMGSLYGRVKIYNGNGTFYTKFDFIDNSCKWTFQFSKDILTIKTVDGQYGCGFGHAVYADGNFKRVSNKTPDYFENGEGTKVYFKTTSPEKYNK
jgi:hypothetical protein